MTSTAANSSNLLTANSSSSSNTGSTTNHHRHSLNPSQASIQQQRASSSQQRARSTVALNRLSSPLERHQQQPQSNPIFDQFDDLSGAFVVTSAQVNDLASHSNKFQQPYKDSNPDHFATKIKNVLGDLRTTSTTTTTTLSDNSTNTSTAFNPLNGYNKSSSQKQPQQHHHRPSDNNSNRTTNSQHQYGSGKSVTPPISSSSEQVQLVNRPASTNLFKSGNSVADISPKNAKLATKSTTINSNTNNSSPVSSSSSSFASAQFVNAGAYSKSQPATRREENHAGPDVSSFDLKEIIKEMILTKPLLPRLGNSQPKAVSNNSNRDDLELSEDDFEDVKLPSTNQRNSSGSSSISMTKKTRPENEEESRAKTVMGSNSNSNSSSKSAASKSNSLSDDDESDLEQPQQQQQQQTKRPTEPLKTNNNSSDVKPGSKVNNNKQSTMSSSSSSSSSSSDEDEDDGSSSSSSSSGGSSSSSTSSGSSSSGSSGSSDSSSSDEEESTSVNGVKASSGAKLNLPSASTGIGKILSNSPNGKNNTNISIGSNSSKPQLNVNSNQNLGSIKTSDRYSPEFIETSNPTTSNQTYQPGMATKNEEPSRPTIKTDDNENYGDDEQEDDDDDEGEGENMTLGSILQKIVSPNSANKSGNNTSKSGSASSSSSTNTSPQLPSFSAAPPSSGSSNQTTASNSSSNPATVCPVPSKSTKLMHFRSDEDPSNEVKFSLSDDEISDNSNASMHNMNIASRVILDTNENSSSQPRECSNSGNVRSAAGSVPPPATPGTPTSDVLSPPSSVANITSHNNSNTTPSNNGSLNLSLDDTLKHNGSISSESGRLDDEEETNKSKNGMSQLPFSESATESIKPSSFPNKQLSESLSPSPRSKSTQSAPSCPLSAGFNISSNGPMFPSVKSEEEREDGELSFRNDAAADNTSEDAEDAEIDQIFSSSRQADSLVSTSPSKSTKKRPLDDKNESAVPPPPPPPPVVDSSSKSKVESVNKKNSPSTAKPAHVNNNTKADITTTSYNNDNETSKKIKTNMSPSPVSESTNLKASAAANGKLGSSINIKQVEELNQLLQDNDPSTNAILKRLDNIKNNNNNSTSRNQVASGSSTSSLSNQNGGIQMVHVNQVSAAEFNSASIANSLSQVAAAQNTSLNNNHSATATTASDQIQYTADGRPKLIVSIELDLIKLLINSPLSTAIAQGEIMDMMPDENTSDLPVKKELKTPNLSSKQAVKSSSGNKTVPAISQVSNKPNTGNKKPTATESAPSATTTSPTPKNASNKSSSADPAMATKSTPSNPLKRGTTRSPTENDYDYNESNSYSEFDQPSSSSSSSKKPRLSTGNGSEQPVTSSQAAKSVKSSNGTTASANNSSTKAKASQNTHNNNIASNTVKTSSSNKSDKNLSAQASSAAATLASAGLDFINTRLEEQVLHQRGKQKKHEADVERDKAKKILSYMEAVCYFCLCAITQYRQRRTSSITHKTGFEFLRETYDLLKFVNSLIKPVNNDAFVKRFRLLSNWMEAFMNRWLWLMNFKDNFKDLTAIKELLKEPSKQNHQNVTQQQQQQQSSSQSNRSQTSPNEIPPPSPASSVGSSSAGSSSNNHQNRLLQHYERFVKMSEFNMKSQSCWDMNEHQMIEFKPLAEFREAIKQQVQQELHIDSEAELFAAYVITGLQLIKNNNMLNNY